MRRRLIEADLIECVLGLGPNLFYNSPMEACVVVCRTRKPEERRGRILFINAVNEVTRERAQSFLTDEHIERIVGAYRAFSNEAGFAYVATLPEIRASVFCHRLKSASTIGAEAVCRALARMSGAQPRIAASFSQSFAIISSVFSLRSALVSEVLITSGSSRIWLIFLRGLSEPYGFWNTI